jgi:hypothetical protein
LLQQLLIPRMLAVNVITGVGVIMVMIVVLPLVQ